jgi:hypothetical protein
MSLLQFSAFGESVPTAAGSAVRRAALIGALVGVVAAGFGGMAILRAMPDALALAGPEATARAAVPLSRQPASVLVARCERAVAGAGPEDRGAGECVAFVDGFVWGHGWRARRDDADMYFCPPETALVAEALPAVVTYLRGHPERLDQPSHVMLFVALRSVWPCER